MGYQVFISYSSKNMIEANHILNALEAKGIRCWMAPRDIDLSRQYAEEIVYAINECLLMVLVLSPHADSSFHVRRELDRAVGRGMPIVPFLIEKFSLSAGMGYYVDIHQWLDATLPPLEAHINSLSRFVLAFIEKNAQQEIPLVGDKDASMSVDKQSGVNYELQSLLRGYFARPDWEEQITVRLQQYAGVFVYGPAGVGKTTLAARIAKQSGGAFYSYSVANRGKLVARNALEAYYKFYHVLSDELPNLPLNAPMDELLDMLDLLANTRFEDEQRVSERPFILDGLDELPEEELHQLIEFMARFSNEQIKLVFLSRNKAHGKLLHGHFHHLSEFRLEELNLEELRGWFAQYRPRLSVVSDSLLEKVMQASEGNFLFLKGLPDSAEEQDYLQFLDRIPKGMESVFDRILERLEDNDNILQALCLMALMPNACSRELLREVLTITGRRAFQQLLDHLSPLTKEVSPGRYILFHARFAEYIRREYYTEICQVSRTLIHNMKDYYDLIYPMSDVVDLFVRERNYSQLLKWMERRVRELEELNQDVVIEGTSRRYETIKALTYGFVSLHESDLKTYMRANDILDRFIASNFQVMVDWRFGEQLWNCLESTIKLEGLNKYLHVSLLYAAAMHTRGQFSKSLDLLHELKPCFDRSSRDFLRCVDYIGLNYGSSGEVDKAIAAYSELLDANSCDHMNVWTGYAMMNRGKLYQRQRKMDECLRDLLQATEVRERMVYDEVAFVSNRSDLADMVQAELTLAMGYENLAKAYRERAISHADAETAREAERYINKLAVYMDALMERHPEETNNFGITGRLLLTLVEYFIDTGDYDQANHFFAYLKSCYVRVKDRARFHAVGDKLNQGVKPRD